MRTASLLAAVTAVLALVLGGTATAHPAPATGGGAGDCASGRATGNGSAIVNTFAFTVCRTGPGDHQVRGYFRADGIPPSDRLVAPQGPVTCAQFPDAHTVSFLYPLAPGSRPAPLAGITAILIVATDGGPNGLDTISFTGPLPIAAFGGRCAPLPGLLQPVVSGQITVTARA